MEVYRFMSTTTGELETTLLSAIKATIHNFKHYRIITLWKYNRRGF